jgi:hypothetical protein
MKITYILASALMLLIVGCKRESQSPTEQPHAQFPGATTNLQVAAQPVAVSEWDKVKISSSGEIFVNKKQMSLTEFAAKCQRLKQAGGGAMVYTSDGDHVISPAQLEATRKLIEVGVPMKAVQKESELD